MPISSYRDLDVWKEAMVLVEDVYRLAAKAPSRDQYELASQMRRAAISVPSNIAEGAPRTTRGYVFHLRIAAGSQAELETQVELAIRLNLVPTTEAELVLARTEVVGRMLRKLIAALERRLTPNP